MDTTKKIANIKSAILSIQENNINALLSICESEIERLFLINIIYYVFSWESTISSSFCLEFYLLSPWKKVKENRFVIDEASEDYQILKKLEQKGVIIRHEYDPQNYYHVIGFSFKESTLWNGSEIYLKILPQYEYRCKSNDKEYRLDFAIFSYKMENKKKMQEYKICIECDGHDNHKSREQRTYDGIRSRALQLDDWKVIRYTGSEIFTTDRKEKRDSLLNELLQLVVSDHF
jgi:very-short-patch-repair endonuclease